MSRRAMLLALGAEIPAGLPVPESPVRLRTAKGLGLEIREFELQQSRERIEVTTFGETTRSYVQGLPSARLRICATADVGWQPEFAVPLELDETVGDVRIMGSFWMVNASARVTREGPVWDLTLEAASAVRLEPAGAKLDPPLRVRARGRGMRLKEEET